MKKFFYLLAITFFVFTGCNSNDGGSETTSGRNTAPTFNDSSPVNTPQTGNNRNNAAPSLADELQGRWEWELNDDVKHGVVFNGDSVVYYRNIEFVSEKALTQEDLDEGILPLFDGWDMSGAVQRELIDVVEIEGIDAWRVTIQVERNEGRFVVEGDRIEILWSGLDSGDWGHWMGDVSITRNALAPDILWFLSGQFNRVED